MELISTNQINLFNLTNRFIYKPVVVQAPRGPFGSILPSSSITAATTKIPTCPSCPAILFASRFWRATYVRYFPARGSVLPPRTVPILPTGLRNLRSPYLKRVLSRVPSRIQLRGPTVPRCCSYLYFLSQQYNTGWEDIEPCEDVKHGRRQG